MADGSNHIDEYEELQDEHEALSLKPSERARFEERLKRSAKTMQLHGHLATITELEQAFIIIRRASINTVRAWADAKERSKP